MDLTSRCQCRHVLQLEILCRSLKRLRRQLENVRGLQQEIEEETELKEGQLARKKVHALWRIPERSPLGAILLSVL